MVLMHLVPGYGQADPEVMKKLRRLAVVAEQRGKFSSSFHKIVSLTFVLRRLPKIFFPSKEDVSAAEKLSGKSIFRQIAERFILLLLFRNEPDGYYRFGFFMPERYRRAGEFIDYRQHSFLNFLLNQNETSIITEDKVQFYNLCICNNLPSPSIVAILEPKKTESSKLADGLEKVARNGGIFFKPRYGMKADGAGRLSVAGSGQWSMMFGGEVFEFDCWQHVFDKLSSLNKPLIFQSQLENHPALAKINPSILHTIRLVTFRDQEKTHVLEALLRLGKRGSLTDNISVGGIGIPIDLNTKALGKGTTMDTADLPLSITTYEPGGREFVGMNVPFFEEVVELGKKVHDLFPEIFSLGHDIAILPDGPVIMETNHIWGDNQETFDVGHGSYTLFAKRIMEIAKTKNWLQ